MNSLSTACGLALITCCVLGAPGGCSSVPKGHGGMMEYKPATVNVAPEKARATQAFTRAGTPASWDALVDAAANADVVLIGENHGHELGLATAAALFEDVLKKRPDAVLALEFLERDQQAAVDDYLSGVTDEPAFAKAANRTPSSYPGGHRAMVEAAKAAKRPVVAANAPRRYVRVAKNDGYDKLKGLGQEQQRLYRVPDALPTGHYRDEFLKIMGQVHAEPAKAGGNTAADASATPPAPPAPEWTPEVEASFRSQSLWDWTMGESVARGLDRGRPVFLVVGRFHVDHEGGTVQAVRALSPAAHVLTVSFQDRDVPAAPVTDGPADFVFYVGPGAEE